MKRLKLSYALILLALSWGINEQSLNANGTASQGEIKSKIASQPPTSTPPKVSKDQQPHSANPDDKTAADQSGTEEPPPIKGTTAEKGVQTAQHERAERDKEASYNWWMLVWNAVTALATFITAGTASAAAWFAFQSLNALKAQVTANVEATNAAKSSADAAMQTAASVITTERAYVFTDVMEWKFDPVPNQSRQSTITIAFKNYGKTPAIAGKCWGNIRIAGAQPRRETIGGVPQPDEWQHGRVISDANPMEYVVRFNFSDDDMAVINSCVKQLYCIGWIQYTDIFGDSHETWFCWMYNQFLQKFQFVGTSDLNQRT